MKLSIATWAILAVLAVVLLVVTKAVSYTVAIVIGLAILFLGSWMNSNGTAGPTHIATIP